MTDCPGPADSPGEESGTRHGLPPVRPPNGWQAPLLDEAAGAQVSAAYEGGEDNEIATLFNSVPKFDRLDLWVHPVMLGVGKKVFDGGVVPTNVTLLEPPVAGPKGTVYLRYGLADGTPRTGT
ncbi:hypothetical protein [Streptomyces sp. NBC_01314]|uniref:hypothetical protein n=1 Tax=Streptomyces sp. NBC_01314 TaxID=2903821 RepID=UPI0030933981|nr:hypothetical protein OG622_34475 [Streptomyces sp. NBC_01314]